MNRVLMVSPHFPPDTSAGTHRVRLIAPYLKELGFDPTVLTVDPRDYEGRLDRELASLVPDHVRVIRARAWSPRWTRRLRFGDLGLRAYLGLKRTATRLLETESFDFLFVTIYPTYPALLGPTLKRWSKVRFVLDYQDPWVSSWGLTAGGGVDGGVDVRSRLSRALATRLEPIAVRAADAITAVSAGTYEAVQERIPAVGSIPCAEIPIGGEPCDYEHLTRHPRPNPFFDPSDGRVHISYVGTLLPLGLETLRAVVQATALLKARRPELYARLRYHFVGTSNQSAEGSRPRVMPAAEAASVSDVFEEHPARVDYLDALNVLVSSSAILLMGSTERHYTASKLYPALLAKRPLLAAYHQESSVVSILESSTRPPSVRLVTYTDARPAATCTEALYEHLAALVERPLYRPEDVELEKTKAFSAHAMATRLADLMRELPSG